MSTYAIQSTYFTLSRCGRYSPYCPINTQMISKGAQKMPGAASLMPVGHAHRTQVPVWTQVNTFLPPPCFTKGTSCHKPRQPLMLGSDWRQPVAVSKSDQCLLQLLAC